MSSWSGRPGNASPPRRPRTARRPGRSPTGGFETFQRLTDFDLDELTVVGFGCDGPRGPQVHWDDPNEEVDRQYAAVVAGSPRLSSPATAAWSPGGTHYAPCPALPQAPKQRPAVVPSPVAEGTGRPRVRTALQLEEALRQWLRANRRLHESKLLTLTRALTSNARIAKTGNGAPVVMSSPEAVRVSSASFRDRLTEVANREHQASLRPSTQPMTGSGGHLSTSEFLGDLRGAGDNGMTSTELGPPFTVEDEEDWLFLTEAERYGLKKRRAMERADLLRGDIISLLGEEPVKGALGGEPAVAWGPPPIQENYAMQLVCARYDAGSAGNRTGSTSRATHERAGLRQLKLTGEELQAAWDNMAAIGREASSLGGPLTDAEVANLMNAYGRGALPIGSSGWQPHGEIANSGGRASRVLRLEGLVDSVLGNPHQSAATNVRTHEGIPNSADDYLSCRIKYRPARTTAVAPLGFDIEEALTRSKASPEWQLELEHCHGYAGHNNAAPNVFLTASGQLVYYAAALGIVSNFDRRKPQPPEPQVQQRVPAADEQAGSALGPNSGGSNAQDDSVHSEPGVSASSQEAEEPSDSGLGEDLEGRHAVDDAMDDLIDEMSQVTGSDVPHTASEAFGDSFVLAHDAEQGGGSGRASDEGGNPELSFSAARRGGGSEHGDSPVAAYGDEDSDDGPGTPRMGSLSGLHWDQAECPARAESPDFAETRDSARFSSLRTQTADLGGPSRLSLSMETLRRSGRPPPLPNPPDKDCPHTKAFREAPPKSQRFFQAHVDDVTCVALHPNGTLVASGEVGREPAVFVWSSVNCQQKQRIAHEEGSRGIVAVAFSGGRGRYLVTVTTDNQHTVRVYDWASSRRIAQGPGYNGAPPQVFGAAWDWHIGGGKDEGELRFVTWGANHLRLWEQVDSKHSAYASKMCSFGKAPAQDVLCAVFLPPGLDHGVSHLPSSALIKRNTSAYVGGRAVVKQERPRAWEGMIATGHASGEIYMWRDRAVVQIVRAYELLTKAAPRTSGGPTGGCGIRCLHLWQQGMPKHPYRSAFDGHPHRSNSPEEYAHNDGVWIFLAGGDDGSVRMWDLGFPSEDTDVRSLIVTGSADKRICLCAATHGHYAEDDSAGGAAQVATLQPVYIPKAGDFQTQAVRAIDVSEDGQVMVVGTFESDIWAFDVQLPKLLADPSSATFGTFGATWYQANAACDASRTTFNDDSLDDRRLVAGCSERVHAVAFHPKVPEVFALACDAPEVLIFHAGHRHPVGQPIFTSAGAQSVAFRNPDGRHVAVGLVDGGLQVFDRSRRLVAAHKHAEEPVFDVKYSPSGSVLAAADGEQAINLYLAKKRYKRYAKLAGHSSSVVHIDFSVDGAVLQSVCNAYEVMYWDVSGGRQLVQDQRNQKWDTWTAKLGFPVMGIWPEEADGSDINSVCANQERGLLAATDDSGNVRLYNFPCISAIAGCQIYRGHASHVEMARFSADGTRLVSVGGADCTALQWRVRMKSDSMDGRLGMGAIGKGSLESELDRAPITHEPSVGAMAAPGRFSGAANIFLPPPSSGGKSASTSIAKQMLSRGREGSSGYVRRRMAEMQEALNSELAKLDVKYARKRGQPAKQIVQPEGKIWGPTDSSGRSMGWIDAPNT